MPKTEVGASEHRYSVVLTVFNKSGQVIHLRRTRFLSHYEVVRNPFKEILQPFMLSLIFRKVHGGRLEITWDS
jgi:hypothetical protein